MSLEMTMPNWCHNALSISVNDAAEKQVVDSLFDGTVVNRTEEITNKLRKIFLAGIGGVLCPSYDVDESVLLSVASLHSGLVSESRSNTERSKAYTEFLNLLVEGEIHFSDYDELDALYKRTGLENLSWGDIPKHKRKLIKNAWKPSAYDFSGEFYRADIVRWWTKTDLYCNQSQVDCLDMRVLARLPIRTMVNGFNGKALNCQRSYDYYCSEFGTKWPSFEVYRSENGNYIFDTAWSPVNEITELLPNYVADVLGKHRDEIDTECSLYYYEPGCAFQGVNGETYDLECEYENDDDDEGTLNLLPEIVDAFGEYGEAA